MDNLKKDKLTETLKELKIAGEKLKYINNILKNNQYLLKNNELVETLKKFRTTSELELNKFSLNIIKTSEDLNELVKGMKSTFEFLEKYDKNELNPKKTFVKNIKTIPYEQAKQEIQTLKISYKYPELFGNEQNKGLESILKSIFQTFENTEVYPSLEEKVANLLYLIIKNHPFIDGNKRIASYLFKRFLELNNLKIIMPDTLSNMSLRIAESNTKDKDLVIKSIMQILN